MALSENWIEDSEPQLVTNFRDTIWWWQFSEVDDRFKILVTDFGDHQSNDSDNKTVNKIIKSVT